MTNAATTRSPGSVSFEASSAEPPALRQSNTPREVIEARQLVEQSRRLLSMQQQYAYGDQVVVKNTQAALRKSRELIARIDKQLERNRRRQDRSET